MLLKKKELEEVIQRREIDTKRAIHSRKRDSTAVAARVQFSAAVRRYLASKESYDELEGLHGNYRW